MVFTSGDASALPKAEAGKEAPCRLTANAPKNQKEPLCGHKNHQLLGGMFGASEATPEVAQKDGQHLWSSLLETHQPCPRQPGTRSEGRRCLQTTVSTEVTGWASKTTDSRKTHLHPPANAYMMPGKKGSIQHLHFGRRSSQTQSRSRQGGLAGHVGGEPDSSPDVDDANDPNAPGATEVGIVPGF